MSATNEGVGCNWRRDPPGTCAAERFRVSPSDYRDLVAWQLANELRDAVFKLTSEGRASRDFKFRKHTEDAASSICRNLSEGFVRFEPGEFGSFVRYAQGSLAELAEQVTDGVARQFWTEEQVEPARTLCRRTAGALGGLRRYLKSERARRNAKRIADRTRTERTKEPKEPPQEPKEPQEP